MVRNLSEYPITKRDVLEMLDRFIERDRKSQAVGGLDGLILVRMRQIVRHRLDDQTVQSLFLLPWPEE